MSDRHRYFIDIDDGRVENVRVECPYDSTDEDRPCWPYDESGTVKDPAPQTCCTYTDWAANTSPDEILYGTATVEIECRPDWSNGDYLELEVLGVAGSASGEGET